MLRKAYNINIIHVTCKLKVRVIFSWGERGVCLGESHGRRTLP